MTQKVLIVDDAPAMRALISARLRNEQLDIRSADSGAAGLQMAREWQPDLILLDVNMPDTDGFQVCRELKADPNTWRSQVVFLTGAAATDEKIKGLNVGATDYITKPFEPAELLARVRACLRTKFLLDLLADRAMLDGLTGLWNRTYFDQRLASEIAGALRSGGPLACVMCDLDHFKNMNDTYGHPFGDNVLRQVGAEMVAGCRGNDVVCRYGGEEFVILARGSDGPGTAMLVERIRASIERLEFYHNGTVVKITCSFGVAQANPMNMHCLVAQADACLYEAKRQGRNRVVCQGIPAASSMATAT